MTAVAEHRVYRKANPKLVSRLGQLTPTMVTVRKFESTCSLGQNRLMASLVTHGELTET